MPDIAELSKGELPDTTLSQSFYADPEVYRLETERVFARQWLYAGHVSRIPNVGDYFLFDAGHDSIIVVRQSATSVGAFHNVCRHRGSRVCLLSAGNAKRLTCPYHGWSYGLDGKLQTARYMPDSFDKDAVGLQACAIGIVEGLIFLSMDRGSQNFEDLAAAASPYLQHAGIATAKRAARRIYPTEANWKLVVDNFLECYHCAPCHPLLSSVHSKAKLFTYVSGEVASLKPMRDQFGIESERWMNTAREMGTWIEAPAGAPSGLCGFVRQLIKEGCDTESADGKPVALLMGRSRWDGGQSIGMFNYFSYAIMNNDYFVIVSFLPRSPSCTDVEVEWFVAPEAEEGRDYQLDEVLKVWDVTITEDKKISERNHAGVVSSAYRPGYFSDMEPMLVAFKSWYLTQLATP